MAVRRGAMYFGGVQMSLAVADTGKQSRLLVGGGGLQVGRDRISVSGGGVSVRPLGSLPRFVGVATGDTHIASADRDPGRQFGPPQLQLLCPQPCQLPAHGRRRRAHR